jgi:ABC-type proline/glycine betaine transport system permease subunit
MKKLRAYLIRGKITTIVFTIIFVFPSAVKGTKIGRYKTITSLVGLYGCEPWSRILREEHGLRASELPH